MLKVFLVFSQHVRGDERAIPSDPVQFHAFVVDFMTSSWRSGSLMILTSPLAGMVSRGVPLASVLFPVKLTLEKVIRIRRSESKPVAGATSGGFWAGDGGAPVESGDGLVVLVFVVLLLFAGAAAAFDRPINHQ